MRVIGGGRRIDLVSVHVDGPWTCEKCGQYSQFAECKGQRNRIFCVNEQCRYTRTVDKKNCIIVENDGSVWRYDPLTGAKQRVRTA